MPFPREIFIIGENWFEGRPNLAGIAPMETHFLEASDIAHTVWKGLGMNATGTTI